MTGTAATETFLDLARKSGAIDPRRLDAFLKKQDDALPDDPAALADALVAAGLMTTYQTEPLLQGQAQRFLLSGKYRLLERLGAGGMASVFLCEHRIMRRLVALKVLPPSLATNESALDRFHREARAAASLDHPNIVRGLRRGPTTTASGDPLHRHRVRGRDEPPRPRPRGPARSPASGPPTTSPRPPPASSTPTTGASSTGTSSRPTCSWTGPGWSRCSTSGWPCSSTRTTTTT